MSPTIEESEKQQHAKKEERRAIRDGKTYESKESRDETPVGATSDDPNKEPSPPSESSPSPSSEDAQKPAASEPSSESNVTDSATKP